MPGKPLRHLYRPAHGSILRKTPVAGLESGLSYLFWTPKLLAISAAVPISFCPFLQSYTNKMNGLHAHDDERTPDCFKQDRQ